MARIENPELLDAFRALRRCEWCGKAVERCQPHHIFARGMGGGGRMDHRLNLIGVCAECHSKIHGGMPVIGLIGFVAGREGVPPELAQEELWRLRRMTTDQYYQEQMEDKAKQIQPGEQP